MANDEVEIFAQYPTATWTVGGGEPISFAVESLKEGRVNRLAKHKRLYRPGARIDKLGADARTWELRCVFFNDEDQEPGINGLEQYPDTVNKLCDSFDETETGDLVLPTRGLRRCCAESYDRTEAYEERNVAVVTFIFVEDNEDDASAAKDATPSAKAVNRSLEKGATEEMNGVGAWSDDMGSIGDSISEINGIIEAPGNIASDLEAKTGATLSQLESIEDTFTQAVTPERNDHSTLMTSPDAANANLALRRLMDSVARTPHEHAIGGTVGSRPTVVRRFKVNMSIFAVATAVKQDAEELIALNTSLPTILSIPAGVGVTVFDTGPGGT